MTEQFAEIAKSPSTCAKNAQVAALCDRLLEREPANFHNGREWIGKPYNRDGVEAATMIAALSTASTPPQAVDTGEVQLRASVQFLLDRLVDHEVRMTSDEDAREWYGHVTPAMARARAALEPQGLPCNR